MSGTIIGRISIVQEDRIRVIDDRGRGYLFTVQKRKAAPQELERWRDSETRLQVRYTGVPDAGARAVSIEVLKG